MEITIADHWPQVIPNYPSCPYPESRQWRPPGPAFALAGNGGHNPVAAVDFDVSKRLIGDLGSWLGSSESRIDRCWITTAIQVCDHVYKLSRNQIVNRVRETFSQ
jgi:hypothetical protein